ncbi:lasso peptide biosynthesis B2 protein [Phenylobacterium sp.]|uniref:lasso peptide biosynthesis B2 protein n=1 Tax=Phenylobacterium sp. TaxID=1871053 RepID=UPI002FC8DC8D
MSHPNWQLPPAVYAAVYGDDLVLLDTARDAYFCLPDAGAGLRLEFAGHALEGLDPDLIAELAAMDLLRAGEAPTRAPLSVAAPILDLMSGSLPKTDWTEAADFAGALAAMTWTYYRRPFARLLASALARRGRLGARDAPASAILERRALAYRALLPWSPVQGACLFQAFLLLEFLGQAGLAADWVFGVRTWPFSAHCWLQAGPLVLNDSVERVSAYRPILVV